MKRYLILMSLLAISVTACKKDKNTNPSNNNNNNNQPSVANSYSELPDDVKSIIPIAIFDTIQKYQFSFYNGNAAPDLMDLENPFTNNNTETARVFNWVYAQVDDPQFNAGNVLPQNSGTFMNDNRFYFKTNSATSGYYEGYYLENPLEPDPYDDTPVPPYGNASTHTNFYLYGNNGYFSGAIVVSMYQSENANTQHQAWGGNVEYYIIFSGYKTRLTSNNAVGIKQFKYLKIVKSSPSGANYANSSYRIGAAEEIRDYDGDSFLIGF